MRQGAAQERRRGKLVGRIEIGIDERDGDRVDVRLGEAACDRREPFHVERSDHLAARIDALRDFEAKVASDQRCLPFVIEPERHRAASAADLEQIAKPKRRHECGACAAPFQQRVDDLCGAVLEEVDFVGLDRDLAQAAQHAFREVAPIGELLAIDDPGALGIVAHEIRKRATDVGADEIGHERFIPCPCLPGARRILARPKIKSTGWLNSGSAE